MMFLVLVALLAQAAAPKAAPSQQAFAKAAKDAEQARDDNRPDEAITHYRQAVRLKPDWSEGWWWLGTLYYGHERWADCRDSFRRFVARNPKAGPGYALLGVCEFKNNEFPRAIESLERANALGLPLKDPMTSEVRYNLAVMHNKAGNFERALFMLTGIARQTGATPEVVTLAGIAGLRKAVLPAELDPEDREVVVRMGRALVTAAERHAPEAQKQMEEIAADFPAVGSVHYVLGALMLEMGDPDGGLRVLAKELDLNPEHLPALVTVAMEYLKRNEPVNAKPYAERAARMAPGNFAARTAYGRSLVELDQTAAGLRELEAALKLAPDSPQVHFALASAYSKLGRKADAARARAEFARLKKIIDSQAAQ
jgi:tetratricopeptide (TPR) repeat protein